MSPQTGGFGGPARSAGSELRIGDADREAAVTALGEHYAAGRLTKEEYDERADRAWAARTGSALRPLFADLPPMQGDRQPDGPVHQEHSPVRGPGWGLGVRALPVLGILGVVFFFTHLPWFLLLIVVWLVWGRMLRMLGMAHHAHHPHSHPRHGHDRWVR